jgi:hypothetical protein
MATKASLLTDLYSFLKTSLSSITDPISGKRGSSSAFIMTSYPQREVKYPLITIKCTNFKGPRAGMQTTAQDISLTIEIRIWARNEKEKDDLFIAVQNQLASVQFSAGTGSVAKDFHNFNVLSGTEIDEPGEQGIKSRILQLSYQFYNVV